MTDPQKTALENARRKVSEIYGQELKLTSSRFQNHWWLKRGNKRIAELDFCGDVVNAKWVTGGYVY
jgi:hypothetical protein